MPKTRKPGDHILNKAYRLCIIDYFKYFVEEDFSPRTAQIDFMDFETKLRMKYSKSANKSFIGDFGIDSPLPRLLHGWLNVDIQKMFDTLGEIVVY
jgi:hypothetical protein